jgi:hypothetical protein
MTDIGKPQLCRVMVERRDGVGGWVRGRKPDGVGVGETLAVEGAV